MPLCILPPRLRVEESARSRGDWQFRKRRCQSSVAPLQEEYAVRLGNGLAIGASMSMIRRLLLSTSVPALLLACAARPELSQSKPPLAAPAAHFDIEAALRAERAVEP